MILGAITLAVAYGLLRSAPPRRRRCRSRSRVAARVAAAGMPVAAVAGVRFALERVVAGGRARPFRTGRFRSRRDGRRVNAHLRERTQHARDDPSLYGWNWTDALVEVGGGQVPPFAQRMLDRSPVVASWTGFNYADAELNRKTVPLLHVDVRAAFSPPIVSGRALTGTREIVLGSATLAEIHKHVGDTVVLSYGDPKDAPDYIPPTPLRIVGTAAPPGNRQSRHPAPVHGYGCDRGERCRASSFPPHPPES